MAQLVVRSLDDDVMAKLKRRARKNGHSIEEEVRSILSDAVAKEAEPGVGLGTRIAARFAGLGLDVEIKKVRGAVRPATFDK